CSGKAVAPQSLYLRKPHFRACWKTPFHQEINGKSPIKDELPGGRPPPATGEVRSSEHSHGGGQRSPQPRPNQRKKNASPKRVLALPDLEQSKASVLNSLTSKSGQRTYDHAIADFVDWYCSEPRLAFNRTVVLRYRIYLEQRQYAPTTINLRLAAVRRVA